MEYVTLCSGKQMPMLGLGTWSLKGGECVKTVAEAINMGYRHVDTAVFYGNHEPVGEGIRKSGAGRGEIFVTTKIWHDKLRHDDVLEECRRSLDELGMDYIDLLLIHWPSPDVPLEETLSAFARLLDGGEILHAGVSNFTAERLGRAIAAGKVPIAANQVEYHPYLNQQDLLQYCRDNGVPLVAYSPMGKGRLGGDELLSEIGRNHGKSPWQVSLRWLVRKGITVIPKASSTQHLRDNMDIFDWSLGEDEMARLDATGSNMRLIDWPLGGFDD